MFSVWFGFERLEFTQPALELRYMVKLPPRCNPIRLRVQGLGGYNRLTKYFYSTKQEATFAFRAKISDRLCLKQLCPLTPKP